MRPKRPSWTSPLTKVNPPAYLQRAVFIQTCVMWVFTRLLSKNIARACGVNSLTLFIHLETKPRALNTAPTHPNPLQQVPLNTVIWNTESFAA
jgi:hypothetical protein